MNQRNDTPSFNLKVIVKETGLKPDTLRAWERRYGVPAPERSAGGHRLYSQRDIDIVKWLLARQGEGLSISKAVKLWNRLEAEERDALNVREYSSVAVNPLPTGSGSADRGPLAELTDAWLNFCLDFDEYGAEQVISQALGVYSPEVVCLHLLQPALSRIGAGWYQGNVTVQQEHFTSELASRRLKALIQGTPQPSRAGRILVCAPDGEEHIFGLLLLTFLLRRRGWDTVFLGASVPLEEMAETLESTRPNLVVSAAHQLHTAAPLMEMAAMLNGKGIPMAFGGLIFNAVPRLRARIPAHFLGESLEDTPAAVEQIMLGKPELPSAPAAPAAYPKARAEFKGKLPFILAHLWSQSFAKSMPAQYLATANTHFSRDIDSLLALGDLEAVSGQLDWVRGLGGGHEVPYEVLKAYLANFYEAAAAVMGEDGAVLLDWLRAISQN